MNIEVVKVFKEVRSLRPYFDEVEVVETFGV